MLKDLCLLNGTSGDESAVRDYIISKIKDNCEYKVDALGSIIAFKKGKKITNKKLMICAHMDEVGFIITDITDDGYLKFAPVGGIDARIVADRKVTINNINGVIGLKPIHLLSSDEKEKAVSFKNLFIDIGAKDKSDAEKFVSLGDFVYFSSNYYEFGEGFIKAKALDDRIGCMLMIELINSALEYDTYFCFNVQEEVGLRGSKCTSFDIQPDISVILESTTAADLCGVTGGDRVCVLGDGPVISFMDGRTVYDKTLYNLARKTADDNNIPAQTKTAIAGGNDAGSIQTSGKGSKVIAISLPSRYIHSSSSVVKSEDIEIISRLDNDYTVCHNDNFNQKELDDFFKTLGFNSILCDEDLKLSFSYDYGITMATNKKIEKTINYAEIDEYPKLMDLFNLEDYSSADFESWYVDVSHRIRHGAAKAVTLNINGEIISSGIFSSIYNNDAILTAVSTQSEFRRMGYASALVSAMVCDIKGKVYLMRDKNKNEEFYKKLGFENIGYWRMYK